MWGGGGGVHVCMDGGVVVSCLWEAKAIDLVR